MVRMCPVCGVYTVDAGESDCGCVEEHREAERRIQAARQRDSLIRQQNDGQLVLDLRAMQFIGQYI